MRKRIFKTMSILTVISIFIVAIVSTIMDYQNFEHRLRKDVENITGLLRKSVESGGVSFLKEMDNKTDYRITYISPDGSVLYDSEVPTDEIDGMSNHMDRPEVIQAVNEGSGRSSRHSNTLSVKTYYYAERLDDGSILRIAMEENSEFSQMLELLPELIVIILLVLIFSFLISRQQTKKIVEPINRINFDDSSLNADDSIYEELYPFIRKINKQKNVIEEQIRNIESSKSEIEAITQNMSEGLIIIDAGENVLSYNRSAKELLDINETTGRIHNFIAFNRNESIIRQIELALKGERSESTIHLHQRVYQVIASPVIIGTDITGAVIVIIDETEKELRDELRREFSANVSHELKTPLTSISGYAEIMESGIVKEEDMLNFAGIIHTEALRLIHLVEDIIKISRLDDNQVELEKEEVCLLDIVSENIRYLQELAQKRKICVTSSGCNAVVYGVRQILNEMVHNLIENAIKYNKESGTVSVSVEEGRKSGQRVILTVSDTGIGIPQNDIERVFERFYRVDKSHSKAIGGTGLGLSIVKHGAIYHNAKIEIESEVNKGTCIRIIFP
ncbi:MAG: sensor histidine kinase [Candidatus Gastranaerophilaceae bacterium]